jgi:hypothetical protein
MTVTRSPTASHSRSQCGAGTLKTVAPGDAPCGSEARAVTKDHASAVTPAPTTPRLNNRTAAWTAPPGPPFATLVTGLPGGGLSPLFGATRWPATNRVVTGFRRSEACDRCS